MLAIRRIPRTLLLRTSLVRSFSSFSVLRSAQPSTEHKKEQIIPGFRDDDSIPTNFEIATGNERYEYLSKLKGQEPWDDLLPIYLTKKGTVKDPVILRGSDPERFVGCTGYPVDTHETVWLTVRDHGSVDRCPHCGTVYKYIREHHHDEHH
ncbi:Cytochrome c oxidase subunit 4 [Nowakowskiella sp. JEL0078]|nr:Cytochrome c oxidase subunit 4 [Nowakowskiella sp. JEL0078]